jgi:GntR family transcriptional regulator
VIVSVVAELLVPRVFCPKERSWLTTVTSPSTAKEVVDKLAINPNTVLKAYRELEYEGLVAARPGVGTFVTRTLSDGSLAAHGPLRDELRGWLAKARSAGLAEESIEALFMNTFRAAVEENA